MVLRGRVENTSTAAALEIKWALGRFEDDPEEAGQGL